MGTLGQGCCPNPQVGGTASCRSCAFSPQRPRDSGQRCDPGLCGAGWAAGGRVWHGKAVLLAALMATQPDSRPSASQRERNVELLTEVLQRHEPKLRRQALRHAQLPDDVDDALQTAYVRFLDGYRGVGEPLAWLYTTVKREAWAMRSRSARLRECSFSIASGDSASQFDLVESMPTSDPGPEERNERQETIGERRAALAELKADERRALWLLGLGFSYAEICEMTCWTHTKVNRCVSEGRSALRARR